MLAVLAGCKSDVIEFLLSSGVSADDTDARGYVPSDSSIYIPLIRSKVQHLPHGLPKGR